MSMNKIKSSAHFQDRPILYQSPRIAIIISLFLDRILYKVIILTNSIIRHVANDTSIKTSYVFLLDTIKDIIKNNFRKVEEWANKIGVKTINISYKEIDPFFNINTKEDLVEAKKIIIKYKND